MQLYHCKTCGELYPFVEMAKDSSKETGLKNFCLKCVREYNRSNSVMGKSLEEMMASIDHGAVTYKPGDPGFAEMAAQCTHIKDIDMDGPKTWLGSDKTRHLGIETQRDKNGTLRLVTFGPRGGKYATKHPAEKQAG